MANTEKIVLGSGKLYVMNYTGELPDDTTLEVQDNLIGWIQGGATLQYTPTFYEAKDDLGMVSKKFLTDEEVILRSGIMTWNGQTIAKLTATARVDETEAGVRTVKIGGIGNYNGQQYVIHFLHEDNVDGDIRITIVGSNEAGFEMSFAKDQETVINAEFKAQPQDNEGTLILYKEEDKTVVGTTD